MSNGWTAEEAARITARNRSANIAIERDADGLPSRLLLGGPGKTSLPVGKGQAFDPFLALLEAAGLPAPEREVRFIPGRQFKADYLFRAAKVIVEREGGLWSPEARAQAAHAMPLKIMRDMEKANLAQLEGFKYFRYTPKQLDSGEALPVLRILLREA